MRPSLRPPLKRRNNIKFSTNEQDHMRSASARNHLADSELTALKNEQRRVDIMAELVAFDWSVHRQNKKNESIG